VALADCDATGDLKGDQGAAGDDPVIDVDQRQSVGPDLGPHNGRRPGYLLAKPCAGSLTVIVDVALAWQPAIGEPGLVGREIYSGAQRLAAKLQRTRYLLER
jgi:hypothetical protein